MAGDGFRRAMAGRVGGRRPLCEGFPQPFADAMWGQDDEVAATDEGRALSRAGAAVCGVCPVRSMCLARAIACRSRSGISGGLGWTMRKQVARQAASAGVDLDPRRPARDRQRDLTVWLLSHPDAAAAARRAETEGRRHRRRLGEGPRIPTPPRLRPSGPAPGQGRLF